jgi:peptidoglycan-N-acetylglucosamine deacetylase
MSPEAQLSLLMRRLNAVGKGIILLHDIVPQTVAMLPAFFRALAAKGYRVVHMVPGSSASALSGAGPGWRSQTERIISGRM